MGLDVGHGVGPVGPGVEPGVGPGVEKFIVEVPVVGGSVVGVHRDVPH